MTDENGNLDELLRQLTHRTSQAFGRIDKRVKGIEHVTVSEQQLEDLLRMVNTLESLVKRVTRIENAMVHWQDQREALYENENILASEWSLIRDRLLKLEGRP